MIDLFFFWHGYLVYECNQAYVVTEKTFEVL